MKQIQIIDEVNKVNSIPNNPTRGKWVASLSDGRTIHEDAWEASKLSPWQGLLVELRETGIKMTNLRLQLAGVTVIGSPNADGYVQCVEMQINFNTGKTVAVRGIGSVFGEIIFMAWVDQNRNIWQDARPLSALRIHSTLA